MLEVPQAGCPTKRQYRCFSRGAPSIAKMNESYIWNLVMQYQFNDRIISVTLRSNVGILHRSVKLSL